MNRSSTELRIEPGQGALVLVGPTTGELPGIDGLLDHSSIDGVEAIGARMMSWKTVSAEVIEVGRAASHAIRNGRTAVVHLDSHVGEAAPVPADCREFVCARLGQVLMGLADVPAYVVTHSEAMAHSLIVDTMQDPEAEPAGSIGADCPIWRLSEDSMFAGLYVALCARDQPAWSLVDALTWFEARRA